MSKSNLKIAIGLMSGTSLDGIDIALVVTDGEDIVERGPAMGVPYDAAFRAVLAQALETAKEIDERSQRPGKLAEVERELTLRHAAAVGAFLEKFGIAADKVDYIGFHGQTVLHRPLQGLTVQLGDGPLLARQTGISVVYDMRANDMANGGQGAPLVPAYHAALAAGIPEFVGDAVMFVNIGGISNVTYIGPTGDIVAFDSGPGNTLIDQWVEAEAGLAYDDGGRLAASGEVIWPLANSYLDHPFFTSNKRLSLDRNDFRAPPAGSASLRDGAATLSFVTAAAISQSIRHLPESPALFVVCGGGRLNKAIMSHLNVHTRARVEPAETFGFNGDSMEAEAWAYLAVRSTRGLPLTFPGTTDVSEPVTGGVLAPKPFLVTDRLALYPWEEGDAAHVADLHATLETSRYMSSGAPWTEAYAATRIDAWMADLARHGITKFKLVSRDDGRFIGRAGFSWMEARQVFELGYAIRREDWGQGYATEIAEGLARWFIAARPEPHFLAFAYQGNDASIHILEKIGMAEIDGQDLPLGRARFFEMVRG